jgi:hypothetical protein
MEHANSKRTAGYSNSEKDKLRKDNESAGNTKNVEHYNKAGEHFSKASRYCYQAARCHDEGNHNEANQYSLLAIGHAKLAVQYQNKETIGLAAADE